jgi:hypothetical protein
MRYNQVIIIFLGLILVLPSLSASFGIDNPTLPKIEKVETPQDIINRINYSEVNVNNSQFLNGYSSSAFVKKTGDVMSGGLNTTYLNVGASLFPIRETYFGYGATYKVLQIGNENTLRRSLALNIDPASITGSSFSGQGQILISNRSILAPNNAGTNWGGVLRYIGDKLYLGGSMQSGEVKGNGVVVTAGGLVGVGGTDPVTNLHVFQADGGADYIHFTNTDTGSLLTDGLTVGLDSSERGIIWVRENNNLRFGTNSLERMTIDNNGNVGIGTASPESKLHIYNGESSAGATDTTDIVAIENSDHAYLNFLAPSTKNSGLLFSDNVRARGQVIYNHNTDALRFFTASSERWNIQSDGDLVDIQGTAKLGIGTNTPNQKLDVNGTTRIESSDGRYTDLYHKTTEHFHINTSVGGISLDPIGNQRMFLRANDGYIGINTGSPVEPLDVQWNNILVGADSGLSTRTNLVAKASRFLAPHYNNSEEPVFGFGATNGLNFNNVYFGGGSSIYNTASYLRFYTASTPTTLTGTERMTIDPNGNVGIATTSPSYKLDVNGSLNQQNGNATINMIYGELYNVSDTYFYTIDLVTPEVYVIVNNLTAGNINGFTHNSYNLTAQYSGLYKVGAKFGIEAVSGVGGENGMQLFVNDVEQPNCYDHEHTSPTQPIGFIIDCFTRLNAGDNVSIKFDDHMAPVTDLRVLNGNLNLLRVGN